MLRSSDEYAYLVDAVTVTSAVTDIHLSAAPTKLMSERTHALPGSPTGVAKDLAAPTSAPLSLVTSVRGEGTSATSRAHADNGGRRQLRALAAGAMSVILVGGVIAGAVYVSDPSVFSSREIRASEPTAELKPESPANMDASTSSIELESPADAITGAPATVPDNTIQRPQAERPAETAKNLKTAGRGKPAPKSEQGEVLDIHVNDPEIPAGGVIIADKDGKGRINMLRVNPTKPPVNDGARFEIRGFNPFPPGFDFQNLSPAQKRKLQQLFRERQQTQVHPIPPQPKVKPTP
jgi:hypothetical protein